MKSLVRAGTGVLIIALAVLAYVNYRSAAQLRIENEQLRNQLAQAETPQKSTTGEDELARARSELEQLPKLRGEVTRLRALSNELAKAKAVEQQLRAENQQLRASRQSPPADAVGATSTATAPSGAYVSRDNFAFAGYGSAEASLNSMLWAFREGRSDVFLGALSEQGQADLRKQWERENKTQEQMIADMQKEASRTQGFQVLQSVQQADGSVLLNVQMDRLNSDGTMRQRQQKMIFRQIGNEWRFSPETKAPPAAR